MRRDNRPSLELRIRVVAPTHSKQALCMLTTLTREAEEVHLRSWTWESGRPTPGQLEDLVSGVQDELQASIVTLIGVQGVM